MPANGVGIIDRDYCGDNDELRFAAINYTDKDVTIEKGSRIAQLMVLRSEPVEIEEVDILGNQDRSGFGTTGLKD
jgi:dUTP pyrophosphatase